MIKSKYENMKVKRLILFKNANKCNDKYTKYKLD